MIMSKAHFNIEDLDLCQTAKAISVPGMFVLSRQDTVIDKSHGEKLSRAYKGKNKLLYIEGNHSDLRSSGTKVSCLDFLCENLIQQSVKVVLNF